MKNEEILGMIPKLSDGNIHYAMFISNKRVVLVKTGRELTAGGGLIGALIGGMIAQKFSTDQRDFKNVDLDKIIKNDDNTLRVPINRITEIRLKKEFAVFRITIFYLNKRNKIKKFINFFLEPPRQQINEWVKAGEKGRDVVWDYAMEHQKMIENIFGNKLTVRYK